MAKEEMKLVANNKKAYHDYFIEEKYEAGLVLHGTEVKSLRMGKCSIKEAFIRIEKGEVYIYGMHISPYEKGNIFNKDPLRPKKLLLQMSVLRLVLKPRINCPADTFTHLSRCRIGKGYHQKPVNIHFMFFIGNHLNDSLNQYRCFTASCRCRYQDIAFSQINYHLLLWRK